MKPNKRLAAVIAAALAVSGAAVLSTSSPAQAYSGTQQIACHLFFGGGLPGTPAGNTSLLSSQSIVQISSLTVSNSTPNAGDVVTVTATSPGFTNGPVAISAGGLQLDATAVLSGAQSGTVSLTTANLGFVAPNNGNYPGGAVAAGGSLGAFTLTGTFVAAGNGATTAALRTLATLDLSGSGADNYCDGKAAGTAWAAPLGNTVGNTIVSTNYSNDPDGNGFVTTGFKQTRLTAGAGGAVGWNVPLTWDPKFAPTTSATITQAFTTTGPNGVIATSTGQNAGIQAVRVKGSQGANVTSSVTLTGSVWPANVVSGGFTIAMCNTLGASCDATVPANSLTTNGSGNISGGTITLAGVGAYTTGNRTISVTSGASNALVPVLVLGAPTLTISPTSGGAGTALAFSGTSYNPSQTTTAYGSGLNTVPYTTTADAATTVTSGATGNISGSFTVNANTTQTILAYQGVPGVPSSSNPSGLTTFAFNADRCVAYTSNLTGGLGCSTNQNVQVSVTAGRLLQRAYLDAAITSGSINGITPNANSAPTQINLGTITTPLAPATIGGRMNPITVTDNRGGVYGWSLTATMTTLTGVAVNTNTIGNGQLTGSPTCAPAINAEAWDYTAIGQTAIAGFDDTLNAPGVTAGGAAQPFSGTVTLCTKNTTTNALTDSTGGVYNVTSPLTLVVPAFQAADTYNAVMTITLV